MQVKHIFHPSIEPKLDNSFQHVQRVNLNGFHHDEYSVLEKAGLFTYINKEYGRADFGAQECIKATLNFGNEIMIK